MAVIQIKITPWDKIFEINLEEAGTDSKKQKLKKGDFVILRIDSQTDLGEVVDILTEEEAASQKDAKEKEATIIRKATAEDFEKAKEKKKRGAEILKKAEEIVKKTKLPIKLVDVHLSLDGGKIVVAFIAPERVDFRDLVKEMSQEFHRSIRLHQINPREEMKIFSSVGSCGRQLCCLSFLKTLGGVKTTLIEEQQLQHRGVDRLSGVCGRLKCCLAFEKDFYQEQIKKMPFIGQRVRYNGKNAEVVAWHILKQTIDLKIEKDETIIEANVDDLK